MDDFPGLLARDFGFRPQGKSASMSASTPSNRPRSDWSTADSLFGGGVDDVFGAPAPKDSSPPAFDSIFDGFSDPGLKQSSSSSSFPVHDRPVYDDDIFDGVPGVKNPGARSYDDVFAAMSNQAAASSPLQYDDLLENLGRAMPERTGSVGVRSGEEPSGFEDLIPGFGGSSPPQQREPLETEQQSSASSAKPTADDPFVVLDATSTSAYPSGLFTDPLEHLSSPKDPGSPKNDAAPVSGGLFDDEELTRSVPLFTSKINDNPPDRSSSKTEKDPSQQFSMETFEDIMPKMQPTKSSDSLKTAGRYGVQNSDTSSNPYEGNGMADQSPKSYDYLENADDVWLTVAEIPLLTQPTSAPPPSRPPPRVAIRQESPDKMDQFYSTGVNFNADSSSHSTQTYQHMKNSGASTIDEFEDFVSGKSQSHASEHAEVPLREEEIETSSASAAMKEAMDRAEAKFKHAREVRERERDAKSAKSRESARQERYEKAMPDAQYPGEEEKQDRLVREREQRERDEGEEQKRREKEREQLERERARQAVERATREARERAATEARLKAERAAVDKANAEARQRAERAAFQKVAAEARERAAAEAREKAASEAREKAASEAREKAERERERERAASESRERERAAAESRERAAAESRERERAAAESRERERATTRERAAVERAAQEARLRAQRAAVERVAAEARERAASEAQRRAAASASAREKQQKTENDLESFFNFGARPSSAPKQRNPTSEAAFEAQFHNKGFSDGVQRPSSASSSTVRKAQSTVNIADDLAFIFGAAPSSGEFQEVEGESEDRRRARLERHQRTLERAAKALAEKNERDMQVQRDQAERHRISETLDYEIKRWAAGKEGNLRALLSTLQYVLWPECGWQPVSLTDLITGASVKKVYRKATLCIHPDKVQQKGATLQQKYIAEKVFDLLKEAWNKFNSEELF